MNKCKIIWEMQILEIEYWSIEFVLPVSIATEFVKTLLETKETKTIRIYVL